MKLLILEHYGREPIIREGILRFCEEVDAIYVLKVLDVFSSYLALASYTFVEILQLSATKGCIDVRHTVVETDVVVTELPTMRDLGLSGDMFCVGPELFVHEEHHTAPTGSDGLVAVERDCSNTSKGTSVLTLVG